MTKILITGANGQLGQSIKSVANNYSDLELIYTDVEELDVTNEDDIYYFISRNKIDYLVNCAAFVVLDRCEEEKELAYKLNTKAVENIARATFTNKTRVIHISSDYVFSGESYLPYVESDETLPLSVYGKTKVEGEVLLSFHNKNSIIIRTSWLYSEFANNFVKNMLRLGNEKEQINVVYDQVGTPTYAVDLANVILTIISSVESEKMPFVNGIFHYSNEGVCSWYDFATSIFKLKNIDCKVVPIPKSDFPSIGARPYFSVLNKSKIKETYNITINHWQESLERCLKNINN